jgi:uncharacterized surface protein with fasciclin (FAS1) repeats
MKRTRTRLLAVGAVAGLVALSACGDDGNDADETDATEAAAAAETSVADEAMDEEAAGTIVDVAVEAGTFETLVAAVEAAGLAETLSGEGPFTVFAPTDEAFAALPEGLVDALLLPENQEALTAILTYHVLDGEVLAADVTAGDVTTLEGEDITISTDDGVMVNEATVTATDVLASNGVIHVIDAVLVPPSIDPAALL